jgi:hypothetical protein
VRSTLAFVAGWCLAGTVAVLAAGHGVSLVADRVTSDRPASLSPEDVRRALARDAAADVTTTTGGVTTTVVTGGGPAPTTTSTPGGTTPTTGGGGTSGPGGDEGGPQTPTTTIPGAPADPGVTRTYALRGGTVTLRFASTGVTVVVAQPAAGYEVSTEPQHGNGIRVEFRSDRNRSRVEGWWDGGPRDEVDES